jgi:hypothetical protein
MCVWMCVCVCTHTHTHTHTHTRTQQQQQQQQEATALDTRQVMGLQELSPDARPRQNFLQPGSNPHVGQRLNVQEFFAKEASNSKAFPLPPPQLQQVAMIKVSFGFRV